MAENEVEGWLAAQEELQRDAFGHDPGALTGRARAEFIRWNVLAATGELHEMLDEVRWKPWATRQGEFADRTSYVREAVDVLHFLGNALLAAGATDSEIAHYYGLKLDVNRARQERPGGYDSVANVDDDGRAVDEPSPGTLWAAPSDRDGQESAVPAPDTGVTIEALVEALTRDGTARVSLAGLDKKAAKDEREKLYKAAYRMGQKVSVKTDKQAETATGTLTGSRETDGTPTAEDHAAHVNRPDPTDDEEPAPAAPTSPGGVTTSATTALDHPGTVYHDRRGRAWVCDAEGNWTRLKDQDRSA